MVAPRALMAALRSLPAALMPLTLALRSPLMELLPMLAALMTLLVEMMQIMAHGILPKITQSSRTVRSSACGSTSCGTGLLQRELMQVRGSYTPFRRTVSCSEI